MNKEQEQFIKDSYSQLEKDLKLLAENKDGLRKIFPNITLKRLKVYTAEYLTLQREMVIVSHYTKQREKTIKHIFRTIPALDLNDKEVTDCLAASVILVDAQLTIAYGLSQGKMESDPVIEIAKYLIISLTALSSQIAHLSFRKEVLRRYTDKNKAEKFLAAYFAFMAFFEPFKNDYQLAQTAQKFFYATGYKRRPSRKKALTKNVESKYLAHYKFFNGMKKLSKNWKKTDTDIIRLVCKKFEKNDDKKTVYKVRSGINHVRKELEKNKS